MSDLRALFAPGVDSEDTVHRHFTSLEGTVWHWLNVSDEARRLLTAADAAGAGDDRYCICSIIDGAAGASYYGAISAVADMLGVNKRALAEIVEPYAMNAGADRPPFLSGADFRQSVADWEQMDADLSTWRAALRPG